MNSFVSYKIEDNFVEWCEPPRTQYRKYVLQYNGAGNKKYTLLRLGTLDKQAMDNFMPVFSGATGDCGASIFFFVFKIPIF